MKISVILLPLLLVVSVTVARPADLSDLTEQESALVRERERRAPQEEEQRDGVGAVSGGVHREDGKGTVAEVRGDGNLWKSKSGDARLDAHGAWSKVLDGPQRGKPDFNFGIELSF